MFKHSQKGVVAPLHHKELNDCSVRSIANASGLSYEDSHEIMKSLGRVDGKTLNIRMAAAGCMKAGGKIFITESLSDCRLKQGIYVVFTQQHSFCLRGGEIIDTTAPDLSDKLCGVFSFKGETNGS